MSTLETNLIQPATGTTLTVGASGDTIDIPSGATLDSTGATITGALTNTPAFSAYLNADQTITDNTFTKIQFDTEVIDTDSTYDSSSNFRWTPGVAGKYFMYLGVTIDDLDDGKRLFIKIYKNGSGIAESLSVVGSGVTEKYSNNTSVIDIADDDDYYEAYVYHDIGSAEEIRTDYQSIFMGYKLIGA